MFQQRGLFLLRDRSCGTVAVARRSCLSRYDSAPHCVANLQLFSLIFTVPEVGAWTRGLWGRGVSTLFLWFSQRGTRNCFGWSC